jgi:hypothetical protein
MGLYHEELAVQPEDPL